MPRRKPFTRFETDADISSIYTQKVRDVLLNLRPISAEFGFVEGNDNSDIAYRKRSTSQEVQHTLHDTSAV